MADWDRIGSRAAGIITRQQGLVQSFGWRGQTYQGARTQLRHQDQAVAAGLLEDYQLSLVCPSAQFRGRLPEPRRDTVFLGRTEYRVLAVTLDPTGATFRLDLGGYNA